MAKTILVVDDKASVRTLVHEYLAEEGFRVVTAENGREALFVARHEKPDLILLDLMMPEMGGYEFMRLYGQGKRHAHHPPHRQGGGVGQGAGPGTGRRRLCDQALFHARIGGPHPGRPAPHGKGRARRRGAARCRHQPRPGHAAW